MHTYNSKPLIYKGIQREVQEWSQIYHVPAKLINERIRQNWSTEGVLTLPISLGERIWLVLNFYK